GASSIMSSTSSGPGNPGPCWSARREPALDLVALPRPPDIRPVRGGRIPNGDMELWGRTEHDDTAGEFGWSVWNRRFPFPAGLILPVFPSIDRCRHSPAGWVRFRR